MSLSEYLPKLTGNNHNITSPQDVAYNCIAWAAEDTTRWWSHAVGYYWPVGRSPKIDSLIKVFESLGYHQGVVGLETEPAVDRVALFAKNGEWTHAARQLPSGWWTSKCGTFEDLEHESLEVLTGDLYGEVHCVMTRPKKSSQNREASIL